MVVGSWEEVGTVFVQTLVSAGVDFCLVSWLCLQREPSLKPFVSWEDVAHFFFLFRVQ